VISDLESKGAANPADPPARQQRRSLKAARLQDLMLDRAAMRRGRLVWVRIRRAIEALGAIKG
jgi:hypothetical protein